MSPRHILVLNSGSSSLKFGVHLIGGQEAQTHRCLLSGGIDRIDTAGATLRAMDADGHLVLQEPVAVDDPAMAWQRIGKLLRDGHAPVPQAIGHRVVHGGPHLSQHVRVDAAVKAQLEAAIAYAPLHLPAALAGMRFGAQRFPGLPQVACLDTCFHAAMPDIARTLPLPLRWRDVGLRRYGFHGLSCESVVRQLRSEPNGLPERLLIAHLGHGASITAVHQGVSIDTSMGLTPTGGLMMGTRSGDLDPGVLLYLMRERQFDAAAIEALVDRRSGLLGISGLSGDMRVLHDAAATHSEARLAIELFVYRAAKEIGAMSVALGGVDRIVFTGGIGENDASVRAAMCARLACLGVVLDETRNRAGRGVLTRDDARCVVQVLPCQEDEQIARHTAALCGDTVTRS
jgi:acetate kinase